MKILILNRGSSSIKCSLFDFEDYPDTYVSPIWEACMEWKNEDQQPSLYIKERKVTLPSALRKEGLKQMLEALGDTEIAAIGHRIVHGGKHFDQSVFINKDVIDKIQHLADLAPLHNLADLEGIALLEELFPGVPQVAVFDTAFHRSLPPAAAIYPGSYSWYENDIRRYGFHGTSFQYCSKRVSQMLIQPLETLKMVICHLGSGASLCAIKEGKSIDTTMGFTPLDGLMMGTRPGSLDPGLLLHLIQKGKTVEELTRELYYSSGLLGISGFSSDMRDIIAKAAEGYSHAATALEVYLHRLNALIGSMIASLSGTDALVFTAGIGENAPLIRKRVCDNFAFLGIKLDERKNALSHKEDCVLSLFDSSIKILLIHTREAFEIARECWKLLAAHK